LAFKVKESFCLERYFFCCRPW